MSGWRSFKPPGATGKRASGQSLRPTKAERAAREEAECMIFAGLVKAREKSVPALRYLAHMPNGGKRSKASAGKIKAMGGRKGILDYMLFCRRGPAPGMAFEFKADANEQPTAEQSDWIAELKMQGWHTGVFYSAEAALDAVLQYIGAPAGFKSTRDPHRTTRGAACQQ